jgi:hypothetical protein
VEILPFMTKDVVRRNGFCIVGRLQRAANSFRVLSPSRIAAWNEWLAAARTLTTLSHKLIFTSIPAQSFLVAYFVRCAFLLAYMHEKYD